MNITKDFLYIFFILEYIILNFEHHTFSINKAVYLSIKILCLLVKFGYIGLAHSFVFSTCLNHLTYIVFFLFGLSRQKARTRIRE